MYSVIVDIPLDRPFSCVSPLEHLSAWGGKRCSGLLKSSVSEQDFVRCEEALTVRQAQQFVLTLTPVYTIKQSSIKKVRLLSSLSVLDLEFVADEAPCKIFFGGTKHFISFHVGFSCYINGYSSDSSSSRCTIEEEVLCAWWIGRTFLSLCILLCRIKRYHIYRCVFKKGYYVKMPRVIGLTGNIACGKTSVGQLLLELGAERYIDADALVHRLYERDQPIARLVQEKFGSSVLAPDGSIERKALGAIVFHDAARLKQLEEIVHPAVHTAVKAELDHVSEQGIAVLDAVKLLEGGSAALCQSTWLVVCPESQQIQRLMERNHLSFEEAQARLKSQPRIADKIAMVDEVIQNGGTFDATRQQVISAFARFCERFPGAKIL